MTSTGERTAQQMRRTPSGQIVTAAIMTILALPLTVVGLLQATPVPLTPGHIIWLVSLCLVLHGTGFLGFWQPTTAFLAGSALMLALAFTIVPGLGSAAMLPSSIVYLLLVWRLAAGDDRRRSTGALAVGLVGAGIIAAVNAFQFGSREPVSQMFETGGLVAGVIAAWALGTLARQYRLAEARRVQESTRLAIIEERAGISRDLHDVVSHSLTVMIAQAEAARVVHGSQEHGTATACDDSLEKVAETGREAMRGLRSMIRTLDNPEAAPLTPSSGIDAAADLIDHARSPECSIELTVQGSPQRLAPDADLAAFRVIQEAVTNAIRHLKPPVHIDVVIDWRDADVGITVRDDGGKGLFQHSDHAGTGLIGLAERVQRAGGTLEVRKGHGWRVCAVLPVEAAL